jgi:PhzF family phenazine biosynthesis protein
VIIIRVKKVNGFTELPDGGNPAGVLLNSPPLTEKQMIFITRELKVSETAFVSTSKKADYKTRFFSPNGEVDLCGHGTIAAFYTMALQGDFNSDGKIVVTQETKAGILPVEIEFTKFKKIDKVMMYQSKPILRGVDIDTHILADSLNISNEEIDDSLPQQIVSTGLFTLPICIKSLETLRNIKPDFRKIENICTKIGAGSFHLFCFETIGKESLYHARNFAPIYGINEDPTTGTANGAVCSYLIKNNITKDGSFICEQGDVIGRPGRVFVEINRDTVRVGGKAKFVEEIQFDM